MPKMLYVATVVKTHIMEFNIPYLKKLKETGWETAVAARNDYENTADCVIPYCDTFYAIPFERNPLKPGNIKAYLMLKAVIDKGNYDIIHCHTPVGAVLTRLAAQDARKKGVTVIYTAHGFHFFNGAPLINWLVYYPIEWWLARKTDVLITINKEDYHRAKGFKPGKTVYVPGVGVDINKFRKRTEIRNEKRQSLGLKDNEFVLARDMLINSDSQSVVVGFLCTVDNAKDFKDGTWVNVSGSIIKGYYHDQIPVIDISEIKEVSKPEDSFVYPPDRTYIPTSIILGIR